jgi:hypothetical protein
VHSANFVAMPSSAGHEQPQAPLRVRRAAMATATPPMLPMPTVPETAVARAWKWETSPGASSTSNSPLSTRSASGMPRRLMPAWTAVKNTAPATSQSTTNGHSPPKSGTLKKTTDESASAAGPTTRSMMSSIGMRVALLLTTGRETAPSA